VFRCIDVGVCAWVQAALVLVGTSTRAVDVLDLSTGTCVRRWSDVHARPVHTLRLNPGSKYADVRVDRWIGIVHVEQFLI
jgi:hypothetical protein